ncbi:MAG: hypothetical protein ACHP91_10060 [Burkholderiales bacterium]
MNVLLLRMTTWYRLHRGSLGRSFGSIRSEVSLSGSRRTHLSHLYEFESTIEGDRGIVNTRHACRLQSCT